MPKLDTHLDPGESLVLDAEFVNELIDRLQERAAPGPFTATASSRTAIVHYDDDVSGTPYPLNPGFITVRDTTDWGSIPRKDVIIDWAVVGVGHFATDQGPALTLRTVPGGSVDWTWAATAPLPDYVTRDWNRVIDGSSLPTSVNITGRARILTNNVDGPSVSVPADLAPLEAETGHRRYVLTTDTVYEFTEDASSGDVSGQGGYWNEGAAGSWSEYGIDTVDILVERAYDPDYASRMRAQLVAERESVFLDGGTARITMRDESAFSAATAVTRVVTAQYEDGSTAGLTVADPTAGVPWLGASSKTITVLAEREGIVRVKAVYTVTSSFAGTSTIETTRGAQVWTVGHRSTRVSGTTSLPDRVFVRPGNGRCSVEVGTLVDVYRIFELPSGAVATASEDLNFPIPTLDFSKRSGGPRGNAAAAVADETGVIRLTPTEVSQLSSAASTLSALIQTRVEPHLRVYEVALRSRSALTAEYVGAHLFAAGIAGRITAFLSNDGETQVFRMRGWAPNQYLATSQTAPTVSVASGHLTAAADTVSLALTFGYGNRTSPSFPRVSFDHVATIDPDSGVGVITTTLPTERPTTVQDGWYVKYTVASSWDNEVPVTRTTDWQRAEIVPSGNIGVALEREAGDSYAVLLSGTNEFDFYGTGRWKSETTTSVPATISEKALAVQPEIAQLDGMLPRRTQVIVPAQFYKGASWTVSGHFRARGGTCQAAIETATSNTVVPVGLPQIQSNSTSPMPDIAAPKSVVFYNSPAGAFCSVGGQWLKLGGTVLARVHEVLVEQEGAGKYAASRTGLNSFAHTLAVTNDVSGVVVSKWSFDGTAKSVRLISGPVSTVSFANDTLTVSTPARLFGAPLTFLVDVVPFSGDNFTASLVISGQFTDMPGPGPVIDVIDVTGPNNTSQLVDYSGSVWTSSYSSADTNGDLTIVFQFKSQKRVVSAYLSSGTENAASVVFSPKSQTLTITTEGLSGDHTFQVRAVDSNGTVSEDIPVTLFED